MRPELVARPRLLARLNEGLALGTHWGEIGSLDGYVALARVKQTQGDAEGARQMIEDARRLAGRFDATELDDFIVGAVQAQLCLAQANDAEALRWLEERGMGRGGSTAVSEACKGNAFLLCYLQEHEQAILARVLISQKRMEEALAVLDPLVPLAESQGRLHSAVRLDVLQSVARAACGDPRGSLNVLAHVLSVAEPEGYVRVFVDEGPPMAQLLYRALERGIAPVYVGKLLAAFADTVEVARPFQGESANS